MLRESKSRQKIEENEVKLIFMVEQASLSLCGGGVREEVAYSGQRKALCFIFLVLPQNMTFYLIKADSDLQ